LLFCAYIIEDDGRNFRLKIGDAPEQKIANNFDLTPDGHESAERKVRHFVRKVALRKWKIVQNDGRHLRIPFSFTDRFRLWWVERARRKSVVSPTFKPLAIA
jgi:hypothetical protein